MKIQKISLGLMLLTLAGYAPAAEPTTKPTDPAAAEKYNQLFDRSISILDGKLADKISDVAKGVRSANFQTVKPLYMQTMPSDDGGWPRAPDSAYLIFSADSGFKPGDDGIWLLEPKVKGQITYGPVHFIPASEKKAMLEALAKWMDARLHEKMKTALEALKTDPDGDNEATWSAMRQVAILLWCEGASPLYAENPNENPVRVHIAEFFKQLTGADLPVAPNPKTPDEMQRAIPQLKKLLYVGKILDHPEDPHFRRTLNQTLEDYWLLQLQRLDHTLAANPNEFASHIASMKGVGNAESNARLFPEGQKITRLWMFYSGPKPGAAATP